MLYTMKCHCKTDNKNSTNDNINKDYMKWRLQYNASL